METKSDYKLRRVEFSEDLIRTCTHYDLEDSSLIGFTHVFIQMYLPFNKEWIRSFTREYMDLDCFGDYFLVHVYVRIGGEILFESYGSGREVNRASDYACHGLAKLFFKEIPEFIMPPFLVGFPNVRGHCFLISAFMPMLYSYPVVKAIFDGYQYYCQNTNLCWSSKKKYPNYKPGRPDVEPPFFWIKSLYEIYKDFHKVAVEGTLSMPNIPFLQKKLFPELRNDPDFPDRAQKPDKDLMLDTRLIKGLCSIMSKFCDIKFRRPGGDEGDAYRHIMGKLVSQLPDVAEDFLLSMEVRYYCSFCVGGPFSNTFSIPVIMVPKGQNFQPLLDSAIQCTNAQKFLFPHEYNGINCLGKLRTALSAKFLNKPKIFCFSVSAEESDEEIAIPSTLKYTFNNEVSVYKLLCSSVCFQCYKSKDGVDYEDFYHEYEDGDVPTGWHTYIHMETNQGAFEVNNGHVYNVDTRVFKIVTPSSIHFYQLEEFDQYKCDLKDGSLADKPQFVNLRVSPESDVTHCNWDSESE